MMKQLILIFKLGVLAVFCFGIWIGYYAKSSLQLPTSVQAVSIQANSSLTSIANQLAEQGVIKRTLSFKLLARLLGKESMLKAGEYQLDRDITPHTLLLALAKGGQTAQGKITFIEGKTFKDMRQLLRNHQSVTNTIEGLPDAKVMALIGADKKHPEGLFFPDTYHFDKGTKDTVLLQRAYDIMQEKLAEEWQGRAPSLPYKNSYEALIMASIIEKETGLGSERPTIGGVFVNRLKIGMRLQTDPTPPTPIATPSLASIKGALQPAKTKYLYFVGKGDRTHAFSKTLAEHNQAVRKYQLKR